ncbi:recombination mediator RecR [Mesosutterella sp. OilRF-GAM-744-9]|uniref:Recombination protein RecR n=1 Tax=Mesosutterella porci TaxID=2915351 RepID=A0ABS9MSK1_9BURK|nr:recombination mediator RecR [Mesosutterella sp. oilRF-744-WT-GAM-9]MCG5031608.1 recombination mediator RecR [Mesosutterella sp. oilRF-744-WT-GAM-9]MCI6530077.1 recombination mediator RecR [Mesosutterella sp.]
MPVLSPSVQRLIDAFRALPGIGPLSAQRIVFHLLMEDGCAQAASLSGALQEAVEKVHHCPVCNTLCESELCPICADESRERDKICVVETPADQLVIENSLAYRGLYFILGGRISPIDDIGPEQLGFRKLLERVEQGGVKEVIIATSFTAQGDATAHFIARAIARHRPDVRVTRLARGIPSGVELEYTDVATVAQAVISRHETFSSE